MDVTLVVTVNGTDFPLKDPSIQEERTVKRWTGFAGAPQWFAAALRNDPDALLAAYVIAKRRQGERVDFTDSVDFVNRPKAKFVDGAGREVEQVVEMNDDGTVRFDELGQAIPILDKEGHEQWRDAETQTVIPFENPTTTTGNSGPQPGSTGESDSGTPTT